MTRINYCYLRIDDSSAGYLSADENGTLARVKSDGAAFAIFGMCRGDKGFGSAVKGRDTATVRQEEAAAAAADSLEEHDDDDDESPVPAY